MAQILAGNSAFDQDISTWDVSKVTNLVAWLSYAGLSVWNYDKLLMAWATQPVKPWVLFGVDELQYCQWATARNILKTTHSWNFVNIEFLFSLTGSTADGDSISCFPPIFQSITISSNNVKNPAYAKSGDVVMMTLALSWTDTWKTGNVVDFTIGTGSLQASSAFSWSTVDISTW
jgi:surface protein